MNPEYIDLKNEVSEGLTKFEPFFRFLLEDVLIEAEAIIKKEENQSKERYTQLISDIVDNSPHPYQYLGLMNLVRKYNSRNLKEVF